MSEHGYNAINALVIWSQRINKDIPHAQYSVVCLIMESLNKCSDNLERNILPAELHCKHEPVRDLLA